MLNIKDFKKDESIKLHLKTNTSGLMSTGVQLYNFNEIINDEEYIIYVYIQATLVGFAYKLEIFKHNSGVLGEDFGQIITNRGSKTPLSWKEVRKKLMDKIDYFISKYE